MDQRDRIHALERRIMELLYCVHGEFCSTDIDRCDCGKEIKALKNGTWGA